MTLVTTPFDATSTAADVVTGVDLTGKRAVVTGGASGIGRETARALASAGAEVTLAVRDTAAGTEVAAAITAATGNPAVTAAPLDLADLGGVQAFADAWNGPLDILVNNAGVMALPALERVDSGWERQFAVNHLGSAALTLGLHRALAVADSARVVNVSSSGHLMAPVDFEDVNFEHRPYSPYGAYGQSKTAMILFTVALASRWASDGITVNALHPGGIMTNLQRHLDDAGLAAIGAKDADGTTLAVPPGWKTVEQGAATSVLLAASPLVAGITGRYFEDAAEAAPSPDGDPFKPGVADYALDRELADRLFALTLAALS
ncbi:MULTISPECIES: SDR family NAD(P)-dependent oxidoreductase [Actinosynnema]|uniref:SDR family NAD(P)-dependent oxidoreductase n=1 Tax=Actinosynnema TaxID=40566 RepID=UPI0020A3787D|nr:SDR family NAD(P)-dependent oxidoreductase [Actinosynnema pretiosum]MCP2097870.1 NAD(P)-dependent dehydrogenase, short-chain alcohol dehydrogenase family [Actinosynnema pretiosum]